MKKTMLLAGAAILALVACNKSQTVVSEPQEEIAFKVAADAVTKADPELTGTSLGTDNAYVIYASASAASQPQYFTEQLFSYISADTKWEASSAVGTHAAIYWPFGGEKVDFLAYALKPAAKTALTSAIAFNASTSAQDLTITDWDTYANQYDVMFAAKNAQTSVTNSGAVVMSFNHAQALIGFTAKADEASIFTLNSITINGLETTGTFVVDNSKTELTATWTNAAGENKVVYNLSGTTASYGYAVTTSATQCAQHLLVPQQEAKSMTINYSVNGQAFDYVLSIPRTTWKMGKKYIYALDFKPTEITVTPSVVDWVDAGVSIDPIQ